MTNDDATVSQILAGNTDLFGDLVLRYHRPLYYYIAKRIAQPDEAEDIVQQAFVMAFRRLETYEIGRSFRRWLWGIARNCCHRYWRRQQRQSQLNSRLLDMKRAELSLRQLEAEEDGQEQDADRMRALEQCIGTLSDRQRDLLDMRYAQGLSLARVAEILNKSSGAVQQLLFRLRQRLRDCVDLRLSNQEPT
jgi:RNA polymerase sigma-70 factor (ECF subfamily)